MTEDKLSIRLATEDDYGEIMAFSKGIYRGPDHLSRNYHDWLKNSNFITFVGLFEGKVIGYVAKHIVDDGKTLVSKALRIDGNYRRRGFGEQLMTQANAFVCSKYPNIIRLRSTIADGHLGIASQKLNIKTGKKAILQKVVVRRKVKMTNDLRENMETYNTNNIIKCKKQKCMELLLNCRCDLFPNNTHFVEGQAYDIAESNMDQMFDEKDSFLFTLSTTDIESFSHTRFSETNGFLLDIVLYGNKVDHIREHILYQLRDTLDNRDQEISLIVCCNEEIKSKVEYVLNIELALDDDSVGKLSPPTFTLYEKVLSS